MEKKTIEGFKNRIFSLSHDDVVEEQKQTSKKDNKKEPPKNLTKTDLNELNELIIKEETNIIKKLSKNYFKF